METIGTVTRRVLADLRDRMDEERTGSEVLSFAAGKAAREVKPEREERLGCEGPLPRTFALHQRAEVSRDTGHPMADLE